MIQLSFSHGTDTGSEDYGLTCKAASVLTLEIAHLLQITRKLL